MLIADDHPVFLAGLAAVIERTSDLELVATCRNGAEALHRIRTATPDVAVLDLRMPGLLTRAILEELSADGLRLPDADPPLAAHQGDEIHGARSLC